MTPLERRQAIRDLLAQSGKRRIDDLAEELGVSSMTIRRDLRQLAEQHVVAVSVGTAYLTELGSAGASPTPEDELSDVDRHKLAIARAAARLVDDGDTIIIDCGTTTCGLLRHIGQKHLTIITNSILVAAIVGANPNVKLIYAPGEYRDDSHGMVGPLAVNFFHTLRVDKAFLGAHGFDAVGGANEPVLGDATAKRAMLEATAKSYLLVDSSKYGNVHLMALSKLSDFSCVITDGDFPANKRGELEAACNEVIYA